MAMNGPRGYFHLHTEKPTPRWECSFSNTFEMCDEKLSVYDAIKIFLH